MLRTIKRSKGARQRISNLIKMIKPVHRSRTLDCYLESEVRRVPLGHDLLIFE